MTDEEIKEEKPKRARKTSKRAKSAKKAEAAAVESEEAVAEAPEAKAARKPRAKKAKTAEPEAEGAQAPEAAPAETVKEAPVQELAEAAPLVTLKYRKGKSAYAHMSSFKKKSYAEALGRTEWERLIRWRKEGTITPVEHPTRPDRARALGYKAKQGITVVRIKVRRGGLRKRKISKGRRARRKGILKITMNKSIQRIAEERVQKHYPNMEVLNSYPVGQDGMRKWFEVILVDPYSPSVLSDKNLSWISDPAQSSRAYRGLTSAGKRGRGLRWKGKGAEKVRPSIRANDRKGK